MSTVGAPIGRGSRLAVWSGQELIVWGGGGRCSLGLCASGARYDPSADRWTAMSETGAPAARDEQATASMGGQLLLWGGRGCGSLSTGCADGAVYDPSADDWSAFAPSGSPSARGWAVGAWTERELFVWGGMDPVTVQLLGSGGLYDPSARTWRMPTTTGAPAGRAYHSIIWTGTELIVWGGDGDAQANTALGDGAAYDPAADTWRPLPSQGAPTPRWSHTAIWTGSEMIIWGGLGCGGTGTVDCAGGARYSPASDGWLPVTATGAPSPRSGHTSVWTGKEMIVWGGSGPQCSSDTCRDGAAYDPATDSWRPLLLSALATPRTGHVAAWTGSAMIGWGGFGSGGEVQRLDGVMFTPSAL
jgi:N-acetylneuraminic acid mutarotase